MTNTEAATTIRIWLTRPHGPFAWPLDEDYEQHVQFVQYRTAHWQGGTPADWTRFCLGYAALLEELP